jgi:cell division protein FtsI/penicillin-binding protein 2
MTSIIANNGVYKKPYVVKGLVDGSGKRIAVEPPEKPQKIISPFVAMEIRKMMEMVVDDGTGTLAALPGFRRGCGKNQFRPDRAEDGRQGSAPCMVHRLCSKALSQVRNNGTC